MGQFCIRTARVRQAFHTIWDGNGILHHNDAVIPSSVYCFWKSKQLIFFVINDAHKHASRQWDRIPRGIFPYFFSLSLSPSMTNAKHPSCLWNVIDNYRSTALWKQIAPILFDGFHATTGRVHLRKWLINVIKKHVKASCLAKGHTSNCKGVTSKNSMPRNWDSKFAKFR